MGVAQHALGAYLGGVTPAILSSRVYATNGDAAVGSKQAAVKLAPRKRPLGSGLDGVVELGGPVSVTWHGLLQWNPIIKLAGTYTAQITFRSSILFA
mgnify:CR=1 FL=1